MSPESTRIVVYCDADHRNDVISLWTSVFGYATPHNDPALAIDRKLAVKDSLFFVAEIGGRAVGTVLGGYDGHRGWIYSLAVREDLRNHGLGTALLSHAETALTDLGCVKINLQIAAGNEAVEAFYSANGYAVEERISMGKRIVT